MSTASRIWIVVRSVVPPEENVELLGCSAAGEEVRRLLEAAQSVVVEPVVKSFAQSRDLELKHLPVLDDSTPLGSDSHPFCRYKEVEVQVYECLAGNSGEEVNEAGVSAFARVVGCFALEGLLHPGDELEGQADDQYEDQ